MKKLINFGLLVASIILAALFFPLGIIYTLFSALTLGGFGKAIGYLANTALTVALGIDQLGNVVCRDLMDSTLRKPEGYGFGNYRQTISHVLGKNKQEGTLTDLGRGLANLLNFIDPGHVERAAESN